MARKITNKDELRDAAREHFLDVLNANGVEIISEKCGRADILCPSPEHGDRHTGNCVANVSNKYAGMVKCFACGYQADSYKLTADIQFGGKEDDVEVWEFLAPHIGVPVRYNDGTQGEYHPAPKKKVSPKERLVAQYSEVESLSDYTWKDFTKDYLRCYKNLSFSEDAIAYLKRRGIKPETAKKFKIGFTEVLDFGFDKPIRGKKIIFPVTKSFFLARSIETGDERFSKLKPKGAHPALFNPGALKQAKNPVFIVEGEIDAISIMQCGYEAIGLGGVGNYQLLMRLMLRNKNNLPPIILALDADEAGRKATRKIKREIETLELRAFGKNAFFCNLDTERKIDALYGDCKDANEALVADEALLKRKLDFICQRTKEAAKSA